jgi:hypothetical protein
VEYKDKMDASPDLSWLTRGTMATMTETQTVTTVAVQASLSKEEIAERLFNGTLHAEYAPVEQFMTIDGLLKSHAAQSDQARKPLICYPARKADDFEEHTARDLDQYTDLAVQYYIQQGIKPAV